MDGRPQRCAARVYTLMEPRERQLGETQDPAERRSIGQIAHRVPLSLLRTLDNRTPALQAEAQMDTVLSVAKTMRAAKANYKIAPKATPNVTVRLQKEELSALVKSHIEDFQKLSGVGEIQVS